MEGLSHGKADNSLSGLIAYRHFFQLAANRVRQRLRLDHLCVRAVAQDEGGQPFAGHERGPHEKTAVRGLRALVVDDVLTTGSTASEAARALLAAGAARVGLVTAAKTTDEKGGALFAPARELPSFVQILRGK